MTKKPKKKWPFDPATTVIVEIEDGALVDYYLPGELSLVIVDHDVDEEEKDPDVESLLTAAAKFLAQKREEQ